MVIVELKYSSRTCMYKEYKGMRMLIKNYFGKQWERERDREALQSY